MTSFGIGRLSVDERLRLVEEIWDSSLGLVPFVFVPPFFLGGRWPRVASEAIHGASAAGGPVAIGVTIAARVGESPGRDMAGGLLSSGGAARDPIAAGRWSRGKGLGAGPMRRANALDHAGCAM